MLALLLLVHHVAAEDIPKDSNYVTRHFASCPDVGYFFRHETTPNSIDPLCYLCFCQDNSTATCWKRENRRCDLKSYHIEKRDTRVRRSPLSLGEIFVRDAAREFFNKQSPEQCKPYESSFSDGCPPVDWCIGCTVCDCDANGRWDCHILSFCPDKNGKKQMKKQKTPIRSRMSKRRSKSKKSITSQTTKNPPKTTKKPVIKPNIRRNQIKQSNINKHKINPVKSTKVKKIAPVKKTKPKLQAKKTISSNTKVTKTPLIIKKDVSTNKPINKLPSKIKVTENNTVEVAQKVVKQFMTTMQKMMKNFERKANSTSKQVNKVVNKRSMPKQDAKKYQKKIDNKHMFKAKQISKAMTNRKEMSKKSRNKSTYRPPSPRTSNYGRNKRQVDVNDNLTSTPNYTDFYNEKVEKDFNDLEEQNKTVNSNSTIISDSTKNALNSTNDLKTLAVYPIPLNIYKDIYILDNEISKKNEDIINNRSSFKDVYNNTTFSYNNADFFNSTELTTSLLFDYVSTPLDNYTKSSILVKDTVIATTGNSTLSTKFIQYSTYKPELLQNEHEKSGTDEIVISKSDKNDHNMTQEIEYKENIDHTCKFRRLLEKLISKNENDTKTAKKPKRYTILTKIKRLFKKIFHKSAKNKFYHNDNSYYDSYEKPQSDHNKIEHCKMHSKEKNKLRQKIYELRNESEKILKTIRIIKGLLQILQINSNETRDKIKYNDSYENIGKLDAVIKDTYKNEEIFNKLSNDQRTQINYIKENVHVFIQSMGNFATILEDIIQIAKYHNKNHHNVLDTMGNNDNYKLITEVIKNKDTTKEKLEKLKKLLLNYNILQNTFVHQIYTVLNNIEANITAKDYLKPKVLINPYPNINKTDAIEANSATIIKNIRRLKVLAEKLKVRNRHKRDTMRDEDAIEYLLILMEYLLQRHTPVNSPPVNDGIDLLIEAIKSAPDIEPIRKKVLKYMPQKTSVTKTTSPNDSVTDDTSYFKSKSERKEEYSLTKIENSKIKTADATHIDEDDEDDDNFEENFQKFKSSKDSSSEQKQDDIEQNIDLITINPLHNKDNEKSAHKSESSEVLKNKVNNEDFDVTTFISPNTDGQLEVTTENPSTLRSNFNSIVIKNVGRNVEHNFLVDTKANTDWIEENFKELKQLEKFDSISTTLKTVTRTTKAKAKGKNVDNSSDVTKEIDLDKGKNNISSAEDVISKKQKVLLNSLDYGVDKEIDDDVDSKEDKFLSDTY